MGVMMIEVEVVYTEVASVARKQLSLPANATVRDALNHPQVVPVWPNLQNRAFGIFGQRVTLDTYLRSGDRLEIYTPVQFDAKQKRRLLARARQERERAE